MEGRMPAEQSELPPPPPPPPSAPAEPILMVGRPASTGYASAVADVPQQLTDRPERPERPGRPERAQSGPEYRLRYRSPFGWLAGNRGLTVAAVVLAELLGGAIGAGYELAGPHQLLARAFCVAFAVAAIAATLVVRAEHAIASVVVTPLCYGVLVVVTSLLSMTGSGSLLQRLIEEAAVQALYSAPGLFAAVLGTALIAAVKLAGRQRHRRRRQLAARLDRLGIPR